MSVPLTRSQELIWAGQALAGDAPVYNQAWCFDLNGPLDPTVFAAAFDRLVERCDALRTVIVSDPKTQEVSQRVLGAAPSKLNLLDFSDRSDAIARANTWIDQRARRLLNLEQATYDAVLLKISDTCWKWFFNQHHLVTDAWSVALLFEAFFEEVGRQNSALPVLPSFASYCESEAAKNKNADWTEIEIYWQNAVASASGPLQLYGRHCAEKSSLEERVEVSLGEARMDRLTRLAGKRGVARISPALTTFLLLATGLTAYLARVSGNRRVTVGAPSLNRSTAEHKKTPGLFVEVFPLTVDLEDEDTFRSLFAKLNEAHAQNMRHAASGASSLATARSFNVVLNYINAVFPETPDLARRVTWLSTGALEPSDDMRMHAFDMNGDGVMTLAFDLNKDTFPEKFRRRVPSHFLAVFDALLADFDQRVFTSALATPEECAFQLNMNDQTPPAPAAGETLLSLFEKQLSAMPDAIAVREREQSWTYAELNARAEDIAGALGAAGVSQGDVVGVHLPRSLDYVASIIGVMKSGAAFTPLDARLPSKRRDFIIDHVRAAAILTTHDLAADLKSREESVIDLTRIAGHARTLKENPPDPSDVAYVLYTSGSTGRPKGVVVDHGGLASYCAWAKRVYAGDKPASMPFFTAIGFDLTLTSLFLPLLSGGAVVVYPEPENGPDLSVLDVFANDETDIVKLTPSHLALVHDGLSARKRIHTLVLGGEDLKTSLASAASRAGDAPLTIYNEYGPTEAIVGCMIHKFDPEMDRGASVPIGVPADGARIYILDKSGGLAPEGVIGEIVIGGDHLARGYWNNPGEDKRFGADPFVDGGRIYRTGDLARLNERGVIEYIGRRDEQIKISGVRIELAEVEAALTALPQVQSAAVITRKAQGTADLTDAQRCVKCGLGSSHPDAHFDQSGVCSICRELETYRERAEIYFSEMSELKDILSNARNQKTGNYDCVMLTSGGKDSTYALARLADMGAMILAVTLDNGYLSDGAKENIERVTSLLGVDCRFVSTPSMNEIFVDSLKRHSNVCNGCFKTIYTLGTQVAAEAGAPLIVTGLSRGQFFETRLTPDLFRDGPVTKDQIDKMVLAARKAYHRSADAVSRCLDISIFDDDAIFEKVQFVDFYRYCDATLDEIYDYLEQRLPWKRPADTGRSSNCLINDAGIYVHKQKEGYHNYALPYSWDVRMGHKERDAAVEELEDEMDEQRVETILSEIGYDLQADGGKHRSGLEAYIVADEMLSSRELRSELLNHLPPEMIPTAFIQLDALPLTENGKLDRAALSNMAQTKEVLRTAYRPPVSDTERILAEIWSDILNIERVGVDDNFYDVGGDSIAAIKIASRAKARGAALSPEQIFRHQTIAQLSRHVGQNIDQGARSEGEARPFELLDIDDESLQEIAAVLGKADSAGTRES